MMKLQFEFLLAKSEEEEFKDERKFVACERARF